MKTLLNTCILLLLFGYGQAQEVQSFQEQALFVNGTEGYNCYRIPAIIKAPNGDLLAFAEGRRYSCSDFGDVDIVLKQSKDNGLSWSTLEVIADNATLQAGNPAPLVDLLDPKHPNGRIFLIYNTGNTDEHSMRLGKGVREVWYKTSIDNGRNWSDATNITLQAHRPKHPSFNEAYNFSEDWRSYALTPGHALQIHKGASKGALFVPANHSSGAPKDGFNEYRSHAIISEDHGQTWRIMDNVEEESANEATAAVLSDGRIMMNIRQQNGENRARLVAVSNPELTSWEQTYFDKTLIGPVCQASILNYTTPGGFEALLFSNPASKKGRKNMTVRMSIDDGKSWDVQRTIRTGAAAYSDLVVQENGDIGLLYEQGNNGGIHYAHFNFAWLVGDLDGATMSAYLQKLKGEQLAKTKSFQLANPRLVFDKTFLSAPEEVKAEMNLPGAVARYTLDGSDPSKNAPQLDNAIQIAETSTLKVRAFHPDFKPSEVVSASFFRVPKRFPIHSASIANPPATQYAGKGAVGLVDSRKGPDNFHDDAWMGFNGKDIDCTIRFKKNALVQKVTVSMLVNPGAWIFAPTQIQVMGSKDGKSFKELTQKEYPMLSAKEQGGQQYFTLEVPKEKVKYLRVVVNKFNIPDWHPGKGTPAWLFIDEIVVE